MPPDLGNDVGVLPGETTAYWPMTSCDMICLLGRVSCAGSTHRVPQRPAPEHVWTRHIQQLCRVRLAAGVGWACQINVVGKPPLLARDMKFLSCPQPHIFPTHLLSRQRTHRHKSPGTTRGKSVEPTWLFWYGGKLIWYHPQADTDLLSDRRARMDEWREWVEGRREWRAKLQAATESIIKARYPQSDEPDNYTIEQARPLPLDSDGPFDEI